MSFTPDYIIAALLIFGMNAAPAFMPPTWSILALFHLSYHLEIIPLVIIGASCATLGRMTLYFFASKFARFLSEKSKKNLDSLGKFFNSHKKISTSLFLIYGFSPIPSNQLFIMAGLSGWDINLLAGVFFIMRLVTYTLWIGAAKFIAANLEGIFQRHYSDIGRLVFDLLGFVLIYIISILPWEKILKKIKI